MRDTLGNKKGNLPNSHTSWEIASFANTAGAGIAPGTLSLISPDGTVMSRRHLSDSDPIIDQLWCLVKYRNIESVEKTPHDVTLSVAKGLTILGRDASLRSA